MNPIRSISDLRNWLPMPISPEDRPLFEQAAALTRRHFGKTIDLFTPLYLSNHCQNGCRYCGFHADRIQERITLSEEEIERESLAIAQAGHGSLLLLTGESPRFVPPAYLFRAIEICRPRFSFLSMEVYPMAQADYRSCFEAGLDGVTLYQETYNIQRYQELHPYGPKKNYGYRHEAPDRILSAGIPFLTLGILLGLSDPAEDLAALFRHYTSLTRAYPSADISLSFPRLRVVRGDTGRYHFISDDMLQKIIALTRLTFPRAGITLSTRETTAFRRRVLTRGVTRMSAASKTGVGGHVGPSRSDDQFEVMDRRELSEMQSDIREAGFDPVCRNWHHV